MRVRRRQCAVSESGRNFGEWVGGVEGFDIGGCLWTVGGRGEGGHWDVWAGCCVFDDYGGGFAGAA